MLQQQKKTTTPKQNICEIYVNVLKAQVIDPCGLSKEKTADFLVL